MPRIVTVNVTQTVAPTPNTLQKTGAFISQGATISAANTKSLLTQLSDLTPLLKGALALATITWSASVATATTSAVHGLPIGQVIELTIAGATPSGYNGTFACTITGTSTFTYALASNPGLNTVPGTYTEEDVAELVAMATTFFAQGSTTAVYVLELGPGDAAHGVTALDAYITTNTSALGLPPFYGYLVPRNWADEETYEDFVAEFESTTAKTYFWTTMTTSNYTEFTPLMKSVIGLIEAPNLPVKEFSLAAAFYVALHYDPSTTNKVTPFAWSFLVDVTPYPLDGNAALITTILAAHVNLVGTGAEGGITNAILEQGTTMDGRDFTYWYSVDWVQINIDLDLSNEVINGSNNPLAPLYYDQPGIDRLRVRAQATMNRGVSFGLVLPPVTVQAVPFIKYVQENPGDYKIGKYAGLSVTYTPQRGFVSIVFNVNVTDFPVGFA